MHGSRLAILLGTSAAGLALLLSQVHLPGAGDVNGVEGDAWPVLLLLAPALVAAVWGERSRPTHPIGTITVIAFGCLAFLFSVAKLVDASRAAEGVAGTIGIGAWVIPATVLIVIGAGMIGFLRR